MSQRIIYETDSGGVAIIIPAGDDHIPELIANAVPGGADYRVVDSAVIPTDRGERNEWQWSDFIP